MSIFNNARSALPIQNKDIELDQPPSDTISCLRFSPSIGGSNYLFAGSWDKTVSIWQIDNNAQSKLILRQNMEWPILSACWSKDGQKVFICGAYNYAYAWELSSNSISQVAVHDSPIRTIHYIASPTQNYLITGGWDKKLKFWNLISPEPMKVIELSDRVFCADAFYPMFVVATGDRKIRVYDLSNDPIMIQELDSPLKYQSRCISIFLDKNKLSPTGFALGSIEGRVAINNLLNKDAKATFTFKCHRTAVTATNTQDIYSVNDIAFHPTFQTLVTVGSDGLYSFWDKDIRTKLSSSTLTEQQSITACNIDPSGEILAYAFGYDWTKGHEFNDTSKKPKIFIRPCKDAMKPSK